MNTCTTQLGIFGVLLLAIAICFGFFPMAFLYATYENLYGEWLQFSAFVGIVVFSLLHIRQQQTPSWCWWLLAVAAFYVAGEEISWGQQVFGWASSGYFKANNLQGETNLHNMFTGPYNTALKQALTYGLSIGIAAYGVLYPWCLRVGWTVAHRCEALGVPAPSICLGPVFALAAVLELGAFHFNETEVAELLLALAMCFTAATYYFNARAEKIQPQGKPLLLLTGGLVVAAVVLTQVSLHSPTSKARVAKRIEAGTKKFAGRYARIGAWDHAINLYQRHLDYAPESRSRLRRLAGTYKSAGDNVQFEATIQTALALDLAILDEQRWRASLHRSLYRTYRMMGQRDAAAMHMGRALAINHARLDENPNSASAAYSFALTLDLAGRKREALAQYRRAAELKPSNRQYQRAYRDARY